jgi:hypothetical protein
VATLEVNDGRITTPFASATIEVLAAEALLPLDIQGETAHERAAPAR